MHCRLAVVEAKRQAERQQLESDHHEKQLQDSCRSVRTLRKHSQQGDYYYFRIGIRQTGIVRS